MNAANTFATKNVDDVKRLLSGFPESALQAVMRLRDDFCPERLRAAVLAVLEFYLPRNLRRSLAESTDEMRLREDLGVDSLALAEATFKLDELLDVPIQTHEASHLRTVGEMMAFLLAKTGLAE